MSRVRREYEPILHECNRSAIDRVKKEMDELRTVSAGLKRFPLDPGV
jgi:hypothetical protein